MGSESLPDRVRAKVWCMICVFTQPPPGCNSPWGCWLLPGAAHTADSATLGTSDSDLRPHSLRSLRCLSETHRRSPKAKCCPQNAYSSPGSMFCSSVFTFSGNKPWCPRPLSFTLNLHHLSQPFLTHVFVLLINPFFTFLFTLLVSENQVFIVFFTIFTKNNKFKLGLTQQPLFRDGFSAIPQQQKASTNVGQRLASQRLADLHELGLLTMQMSFPRQDGQGVLPSFSSS